MARLRAHNIAISLDGYGSGEGQSFETPFGHAGMRLMEWFFPTATFQGMSGERERTDVDPRFEPDDVFARAGLVGIGAEIMGANKYGPPGWPEDPTWRGWWGEEPPFHTPVFVHTHSQREPLVVGDTTFHFVSGTPAEVFARATEAAGGLDVRLGGGPTIVREYLAAGLVDYLHVVQVPIILGRGSGLWDGLEGLESGYQVHSTTTPSGVTHLVFDRRQ